MLPVAGAVEELGFGDSDGGGAAAVEPVIDDPMFGSFGPAGQQQDGAIRAAADEVSLTADSHDLVAE